MDQIVECVPNFSEGRDQKIIDALSQVFENAVNVYLLQVDAGQSTNRTVYTLVGQPEAIVRVMLEASELAYRLIDMRTHQGEHKRLGALDVCPFVPVRNLTMNDCVALAEQFASQLAERLQVPVFLYGHAARHPSRRQVPDIREGEYERLSDRLELDRWKPDFGPAKFVPTWGASIVGARQFLIAYNVNLGCTRHQANTIAFNIRESGRPEKQQIGRLAGVQAMGWNLDEAGLAQVTVNILDHHRTPLHRVWDEVCSDARQMQIPVFGSEVVGVIPLNALTAAADHFISQDNLLVLGEEAKVRLAVHRLGLSYLSAFRPEERVIEYILRTKLRQSGESTGDSLSTKLHLFRLEGLRGLRLCGSSVERLVESVANREPVPGGGSVSALIGSFGSALAVMVGRLSSGCAAYAHNETLMRHLLPPLYDTCESLLQLVDQDSDAFSALMNASRKRDYESEQHKTKAIQEATEKCIHIPLTLATTLSSLWPNLVELNKIKNENASSDLIVAAYAFVAAIQGALANVEINLNSANLNSAYIVDIKAKVADIRAVTKKASNELKLI